LLLLAMAAQSVGEQPPAPGEEAPAPGEVVLELGEPIQGADEVILQPTPGEPVQVEAAAEPAVLAPAAAQPVAPLAELIIRAFVPNPRNRDVDRREAQIKQVMPQFAQSYRPVLLAELAFIRQMCDIPKEQRIKVKAAGEAGLQQAARTLAEQQFGGNRVVAIRRDPRSSPDPRRTVRDSLVEVLKQTLTPEQLAQYTAEAEKRDARRKRAAILSAIAQFDTVLSLTAEQREALHQSIAAHWQERWEQWLSLANYGGQYFPTIPDQVIVSHLNQEQRQVLQGLQRIEIGFSSGAEEPIPDDGWWGEPLNPQGGAAVIGDVFFEAVIE
jgi:hypothetical protein